MRTQAEVKHTATPTTDRLRLVDEGPNGLNLYGEGTTCIATIHSFRRDGELIVRAVNAHQQLVEALSVALAAIVNPGTMDTVVVIGKVKAALKAAGE